MALSPADVESLFRDHQRRLERVVNGIVLSLDDAEQVVVDTFVKLYERRDAIDAAGAPRWLTTVATRDAWAVAKRAVRGRHLVDRATRAGFLPAEHTTVEVGSELATREVVLALLHRLAPRQRAIVALRVLEGYSQVEVGEILGISDRTVAATLSRVRRDLRGTLDRRAGL